MAAQAAADQHTPAAASGSAGRGYTTPAAIAAGQGYITPAGATPAATPAASASAGGPPPAAAAAGLGIPAAEASSVRMKHVLADNGVLNLGGGVSFKIPLWYDDLAKTGLVARYSGDSIGVTRGVCGVGVTRVGGGLDLHQLVCRKWGLCLHAACSTGNGCVKAADTSRTGI